MEPILSAALQIDYGWLPCDHGSREERVTLADVAVFAGDQCATELDDRIAKTVRHSARLSALHLAQWFATNLVAAHVATTGQRSVVGNESQGRWCGWRVYLARLVIQQ